MEAMPPPNPLVSNVRVNMWTGKRLQKFIKSPMVNLSLPSTNGPQNIRRTPASTEKSYIGYCVIHFKLIGGRGNGHPENLLWETAASLARQKLACLILGLDNGRNSRPINFNFTLSLWVKCNKPVSLARRWKN